MILGTYRIDRWSGVGQPELLNCGAEEIREIVDVGGVHVSGLESLALNGGEDGVGLPDILARIWTLLLAIQRCQQDAGSPRAVVLSDLDISVHLEAITRRIRCEETERYRCMELFQHTNNLHLTHLEQ